MRYRTEYFFLAAVILHNGLIRIGWCSTPLLLRIQFVLICIPAIILVVAGTVLVSTAAEGIAAVYDLEKRL
jgi:hypothetical protein